MKIQSQQKGTFGTYLDLVKGKRSVEQSSDDLLFGLLKSLSETDPQPIPDVLSTSGMSVSEFATSLQTLQELDMVNVGEEEDRGKVVALTAGGARFVSFRGGAEGED